GGSCPTLHKASDRMSSTTNPTTQPVAPQEIFDTSTTFDQLGLREDLMRGVREAGFVHPTIIQSKLLPPIMAGKDVIGQAKTGTGKTAAFGLPILNMADPDVPMQALILVPTRELAT